MKKKKLVLIVEDEEALLKALNERLVKLGGLSVIEARDGEIGLKLVQENQPDLVILDLVLPKTEGMIVLRKIRQHEWGVKIPIIVLTNLSVPEKEAEARELGVKDYFVKTDVTLDEVVDLVKKRLV